MTPPPSTEQGAMEAMVAMAVTVSQADIIRAGLLLHSVQV